MKTTYPNQLDYTEFYDAKILRAAKKKVLPGLEPGLQGSKPWVLTNYTREPSVYRTREQAGVVLAIPAQTKQNPQKIDVDEI